MGAPSPDLPAIGLAIRTARARTGLSQSAFGHRYGLTQGQLSKLETGTMREFSAPVERAIVRIVGKWLYRDKGPAASARAMQSLGGMTPDESALVFPLIRSALELIRKGRQQDVAVLTATAEAMATLRRPESPAGRAKRAR